VRNYFVLLIALSFSSTVYALDINIGGAGVSDAPYKSMSILGGGDGKSTVKLVMKDGSQQEHVIPNYSLSNPDSALRNMVATRIGDSRFLHIQLKQAQGEKLTQEEASLIAQLAADSKIYDDNLKLIKPLCAMPSHNGISVMASSGVGVQPCSALSAEEIAAAPHIEKDKDVRTFISVAGAPYRFKLPKEQRQKLRRQNIGLAIKWSEME